MVDGTEESTATSLIFVEKNTEDRRKDEVLAREFKDNDWLVSFSNGETKLVFGMEVWGADRRYAVDINAPA